MSIDSFGGRKTVAAIATLALGMIVTYSKGDIPPNLLQLLGLVFGGFVMGNVGEHVAGIFKTKAAEAPTLDTSGITVQLDNLTEATAATQQGVSLLVNYVSQAK